MRLLFSYFRRFAATIAIGLSSAACLAQTSLLPTTSGQQPDTSSGGYVTGNTPSNAAGSVLPSQSGIINSVGTPINLTPPQQQGAPLPYGMSQPADSMALPYVPGEFETYVQGLAAPQDIKRLGANLVMPTPGAVDASPLVPADYLLVPGDELQLSLWGSVDADFRTVVDRSGRIVIPRVGPVLVAGTRYADVPALISKRLERMFKGVQVSVSLAQLRAVRVYVTGYVNKPGAHSLPSLSTISSAVVKAGGPTAAGSFRQITLLRKGQSVATFDFYDLLISGSRAADLILQPDDVVHVGPVGPQVAIIGSVNQPGVMEVKPGDRLETLLRLAGGPTAVADMTRAAIEPLTARGGVKVVELALPAGGATELHAGDVVRIFSVVDAKLPLVKQNKRVVVEGEVVRPGTYVLPADSTVADAMAAAGGMTRAAYVFGTQFTRLSVRQSQQVNYDRALRDLESDLTRSATTQRAATADEVAGISARAAATSRLIAVLRTAHPDGRVVLQLPSDAKDLPNLPLEDGDRIYVPAQPTSIGVFGSVFNAGSFLNDQGRSVEDFIQLAGGPTRGADKGSTFVIRANGSVVSNLQSNGWFSSDRLTAIKALPGDTVFVPEEMNKTTFLQNAKDWTQILYQFGIGAAALQTLK